MAGVYDGKQMSDWEQGIVAMASLAGFVVLQWTVIMALTRWASGKDSPSWHGVALGAIRWVRTGRLTEPVKAAR